MTKKRTLGWIQNPHNLQTLKKVVSLFVSNSTINLWLLNDRLPLLLDLDLISKKDFDNFTEILSSNCQSIAYGFLKGKGCGSKGRSSALCTGIVQAVIDGQKNITYKNKLDVSISIKKPYTDDWSADGYIRWAIACGLLEYDNKSDTCTVTPLGIKLCNSTLGSNEEYEAFFFALLSYPPVIRILSLLNKEDELTKFDLGKNLGFKSELGFTSIPREIFLCDICEAPTPKERTQIRSNEEGDSDKYARTIARWCMQMGWVTSSKKEVTNFYRGSTYIAELQTYSITRSGEKALAKSRGYSRYPRIPKIVSFEMLASNKTQGANFLRLQRAYILESLSKSSKSLNQLQDILARHDIKVDISAIKDHIIGLQFIGLDITEVNGRYKLAEKVKQLVIPDIVLSSRDTVNEIIDRVQSKLQLVNHSFLPLINFAFSNASKGAKNAIARDFEILTAKLFSDELGIKAVHLGGPNRPDVLVYNHNFGIIIDNKSYKDGFNINASCRDEMSRYVNENIQRNPELNSTEWWKNFNSDIKNFAFLFVTSIPKGDFEKQLEYISLSNDGIKGAVITAENLLYIAEEIKSEKITFEDFFAMLNNNEINL